METTYNYQIGYKIAILICTMYYWIDNNFKTETELRVEMHKHQQKVKKGGPPKNTLLKQLSYFKLVNYLSCCSWVDAKSTPC